MSVTIHRHLNVLWPLKWYIRDTREDGLLGLEYSLLLAFSESIQGTRGELSCKKGYNSLHIAIHSILPSGRSVITAFFLLSTFVLTSLLSFTAAWGLDFHQLIFIATSVNYLPTTRTLTDKVGQLFLTHLHSVP